MLCISGRIRRLSLIQHSLYVRVIEKISSPHTTHRGAVRKDEDRLFLCSSGSIHRLSLVWHRLYGGVLPRRVSVDENEFVKFRSRTYRCRTSTKDLLCVDWLLPDVRIGFKFNFRCIYRENSPPEHCQYVCSVGQHGKMIQSQLIWLSSVWLGHNLTKLLFKSSKDTINT